MQFKPLSEKEADDQSANLWQDGTYDFEVREASEEVSNSGNEMVKLEVWIYNQSGGRRLIFDYLVNSENSAWKIRHFAGACGLLQQYDRGTLIANEMVGRTGKCNVGTQPAKDGYQAKNVIRGYIKIAGVTSRVLAPVGGGGGDLDDAIPFSACWQ